jgi:hypothetical protein
MAEAGRNPDVAKSMRESSRKIQKMLADYLRKGQASGQIDQSLDAEFSASLLISIFDGMKTLAIRDPKVNMENRRRLENTDHPFLDPLSKTR